MNIDLILASGSPRRKELMANAGLDFRIVVPAVEEKRRAGESPEAYSQRNAKEKVLAVLAGLTLSNTRGIVAIAADTIVVLQGDILEKPKNTAEAAAMLGRLSANTHVVLTAVAVAIKIPDTETVLFGHLESTEVEFKELSASEIERYVASGEPMDKAGAYAAQGIGAYMISHIKGSYTNVIGLPVTQLFLKIERELKLLGLDWHSLFRG